MNDASSSASAPQSSPGGQAAPKSPAIRLARAIVYLGLAAALAALAYEGFKTTRAKTSLKDSQDTLSGSLALATPALRRLAAEYSDKQGRLLADPPSDPQKLLNPETLVLAYSEDADVDVQPVNWNDFQKHLSQITGKQVVTREYFNTVGDVAAIKDGKIHVVALHAADTPFLVNNAGFVPVAVLGSDAGARGNHLVLAVAPTSSIKAPADLKGRTLTTTRPTSITGHRAAIAVLLRDAGLRPNVDYFINYSFSQTRSIEGLAGGDYEATALSDDKLQSLLKVGRVKPSDYRIVYESQVIPRFTIGYVYNMQPDLAAKVTQAVLEFKNESGPVEEGNEKPMRFFAVDYKKDFEFVRTMDESFEPRLAEKPPKSEVASEPAPD